MITHQRRAGWNDGIEKGLRRKRNRRSYLLRDSKNVSDLSTFYEGNMLTYCPCSTDDPSKDPQVRGDPYRTLFVARLSYDTKEADLEREFGRFGPIERVCSVNSQKEL